MIAIIHPLDRPVLADRIPRFGLCHRQMTMPDEDHSDHRYIYASQESKLLARQVTTRDIVDFYVRNMVNENLGAICNAHVVHADLRDYGAMSQNCITLAELAATAVDFPKTGKIVSMPHHLKPKLYPDFMGKQPH
ncbi:hypothetical protein K1719_000158 [Acacia pycnantha]|nr:hypothetical protein K1719_000158 [Acacia pycnantha]